MQAGFVLFMEVTPLAGETSTSVIRYRLAAMSAVAGMSGGPVVDIEGRLVGVMVRATNDHGGVSYVRAVRMSHVSAELVSAFESLPGEAQEAVGVFLER